MDPPQRCDTVSRMTTRRHSLRRGLRLPVSLGRRLPALTADVSRGGFMAELPQVFLPGSRVHGFILVNDAEVPFHGTVAWAEPGNPMASVYSRMGVRFDALPDALVPLFTVSEGKKKRFKLKAR